MGNFLGLYETIGFLILCGDPFEVFLNYGYDLEKSKVSYSAFRKKKSPAVSVVQYLTVIKFLSSLERLI